MTAPRQLPVTPEDFDALVAGLRDADPAKRPDREKLKRQHRADMAASPEYCRNYLNWIYVKAYREQKRATRRPDFDSDLKPTK